jgi:hypothetical protein
MEKKKLLVAVFVTLMMVFTAFTPMSKIVGAAMQDNLKITFRFIGNRSVDLSVNTYNFTTVWAGGMKNTSTTQFTVWNNGTAVVTLQVEITSAPTGLTSTPHNHPPTGTDTYALYGLKGTIQYTPWYNTTSYQNLELKLNKSQPRTFGLRLYAGNVSGSNNATWKMMNVTYRAA